MNIIFTARLHKLRKERGISQKDAAAGLGISQSLLSHYEKGIRECGLDFLIKASEFYSVTCDYLLGLSDSRLNFGGELEITDIPEDAEMTYQTIMRSAAAACELLYAKGGGKFFNNAVGMYSISVYKALLAAREQGFIRNDIFKFDIKTSRYSSTLFMKKLEDELMEMKPEIISEKDDALLSMETLVHACEEYMKNELDNMVSEFQIPE